MNLSLLWAAAAAAASSLVGTATAAAGCFEDGSPFHPDDWTYCQPISDTLYMYYTPMDDTVMLGLHATEGVFGWSALGPGGNGGMKGMSPIVIRKDDTTGEWIAEDRNSMDYVTPDLDAKQDVQLLFAQQDEATGETAWGVVLPQNSCDEPYDYAIEDRAIFMLWALGTSHSFAFHGTDRGQFTANLMNAPPTKPDMEDYDHIDLLMPNVTMVRGEEDSDPTNPFICTYFDMDVLGEEMGFTSEDKVHVVGYEAVQEEGNEQFLHHFVVTSCEGQVDFGRGEDNEPTGGFSGVDDSGLYHHKVIPACTSMPPGCTSFVAGWAVGSAPLTLPENVGIPIGEGHRWMVMQTHYYNPNMVPDVYDSSGMRMHLTKDLRPTDAGTMAFVVGVVTGQAPPLPGGMKDVAMDTLYAEPDCTKAWTEPLHVIEVGHHSHFKGSYQEIVVERDGVNLGPMRKEFLFDYNHQTGMDPVNALKTLMPGDRFAATCRFDTSDVSADSVVEIGEESNREMCLPSFLYYPKQELTSFLYLPPSTASNFYMSDLEWCSQPSVNEDFENLCLEKLYADVPGFANIYFRFMVGYDGPSVDYPTLCNGGNETAGLRDAVTGICPDFCGADTESCSEEVLLSWANGICQSNCDIFGLTLYPDLNRTEGYNTANIFCPNALFDVPTLKEPPACQLKGSLPQTIELRDVTSGTTDQAEEPAPEDVGKGSETDDTDTVAPVTDAVGESSGARSILNPLAVLLFFCLVLA